MLKSIKIISMLTLTTAFLFGCATQGSGNGNDNQLKIAGILMQSDVEWFKEVEAGMQDAADENDVDLTIGNSDEDVTEEADLLDTYSAQGMDAVLVSAVDPSSSAEAIKRAQEKDTTVVNYNTHIDESEEYFVGIDNYDLGKQAGESLLEYVDENLDGEAKVAMVTLSMHEIGQERAEGFEDAIEENSNIEVVAKQDASGPEEGADVTETMLQGNPDIDIIWGANEGGAIGAVVGTDSKGMSKDVKIFGTDMSSQTADYLLEDESPYYTVSTQQPYEIGYEALQVAVEALENGDADEENIIPLDLYSEEDKDKVEEYLDDVENLE